MQQLQQQQNIKKISQFLIIKMYYYININKYYSYGIKKNRKFKTTDRRTPVWNFRLGYIKEYQNKTARRRRWLAFLLCLNPWMRLKTWMKQSGRIVYRGCTLDVNHRLTSDVRNNNGRKFATVVYHSLSRIHQKSRIPLVFSKKEEMLYLCLLL